MPCLILNGAIVEANSPVGLLRRWRCSWFLVPGSWFVQGLRRPCGGGQGPRHAGTRCPRSQGGDCHREESGARSEASAGKL